MLFTACQAMYVADNIEVNTGKTYYVYARDGVTPVPVKIVGGPYDETFYFIDGPPSLQKTQYPFFEIFVKDPTTASDSSATTVQTEASLSNSLPRVPHADQKQ